MLGDLALPADELYHALRAGSANDGVTDLPALIMLASQPRAIRPDAPFELHRRTGYALRDLGPMRAARRDALLGLGIRDRRFGWPLEMVVRAAGDGWRVVEVPVPYAPRTGRSKAVQTSSNARA